MLCWSKTVSKFDLWLSCPVMVCSWFARFCNVWDTWVNVGVSHVSGSRVEETCGEKLKRPMSELVTSGPYWARLPGYESYRRWILMRVSVKTHWKKQEAGTISGDVVLKLDTKNAGDGTGRSGGIALSSQCAANQGSNVCC